MERLGGGEGDLGVGVAEELEEEGRGVVEEAAERAGERGAVGGGSGLEEEGGVRVLVEDAEGDLAAAAGGGKQVAGASAGLGVGMVAGGLVEGGPRGASGRAEARGRGGAEGGVVVREFVDRGPIGIRDALEGAEGSRYGEYNTHDNLAFPSPAADETIIPHPPCVVKSVHPIYNL